MKYKAAVFDLDGTIVDTRQDHIFNTVGRTLHEFGMLPTPEIGKYATFANQFWKGFADRDMLIGSLGIDADQFWDVFRNYDSVEERVANSFVYPDFEVINQLKRRGIKTGIVTDAPESVAGGELKLVDHQFDQIVCAEGEIPAKPRTEGLMKCLKMLGASVNEAVYLGNANVDVKLGKNAGIFHGIIVRENGYELQSAPDFYVNDLFEFRDKFF